MSNHDLFLCTSIVPVPIPGITSLKQNVQVYWYRVGPRAPSDAHYKVWIAGYEDMDENKQAWMKWVTDSI
jgi:hypothetical protein